MTRQIHRRQAALDDLADQAAWYMVHVSDEVADRFLAAAEETLELLLATPGIGAPRHYVHPALHGLRMHLVRGFGSHLIFYRVVSDGIELIRILHAARNVDAILVDESNRSK